MKIEEIYKLYQQTYKVATDTRKDLNGAIFFALKGDNFNGNRYAEKALTLGANYAIVDEEEYQTDDRMILVENVLICLQDLARFHRFQLGTNIIALTGSNGKTTTKELISAVLSQKFKTKATLGNLNNHIGVPLTLLSITPEVEMAVVEMGANHPLEIETLCNIAYPDVGYITNFGKVHLEGFGSLDGVIESKTEMYRHLQKHEKMVFVNADDPVQMKRSNTIKRIVFGSSNSDFNIEFLGVNPFVKVSCQDIQIQSQLIGQYNFTNIAVAIAFGLFFKIDISDIKKGIETYVPTNNRSQIIEKGNIKIILDAYNANPNSMEAALENLAQLSGEKKIAILGDMFEIGDTAIDEHNKIVQLVEKLDIDMAILIGQLFESTKVTSPKIKKFKDLKEFELNYNLEHLKHSTLLIKASRGMALERIVEMV